MALLASFMPDSLHSMYQANKLPWIFITCKKWHTDAPSLKMTKMSSTNPLSIKGKRKQPPIYFVIGSLFDVVELLPLLCVFGDFYVKCFLATRMVYPGHKHACSSACMWVHKLANSPKQFRQFSSALSSHHFSMMRQNMKSQRSCLQYVLCFAIILYYVMHMHVWWIKLIALQCVLNSFLTFSMFNSSIKSSSLWSQSCSRW